MSKEEKARIKEEKRKAKEQKKLEKKLKKEAKKNKNVAPAAPVAPVERKPEVPATFEEPAKVEAPKAEVKVETPKVEAPKTEVKVEPPKVEAPKAEVKAEAPKKAETVKAAPKAAAAPTTPAPKAAKTEPMVKGFFAYYKTDKGGFAYRLKANNHETIAICGGAYSSLSSCKVGINSVRSNCTAHIEDQTLKTVKELPNPKYEIYVDKAGKFRYRLRAKNGEIIAIPEEGYASKASCKGGIASIGRFAPNADVVEEKE